VILAPFEKRKMMILESSRSFYPDSHAFMCEGLEIYLNLNLKSLFNLEKGK
jgi:hypothetical protein